MAQVLKGCERKRMTASERDGLMELAIIDQLTNAVGDSLERRIRNIKGERKWLGLLKYCADRIFKDMMDTVPTEQLEAFRRNVMGARYRLGVKSPAKDRQMDEWGLWCSFADLEAITEAGKEKCLTCDLCDGRERQCELRKALDNLGSEVEHDDKGSGCAYRWM